MEMTLFSQKLKRVTELSARLQSLLESDNFYQEVVNILHGEMHQSAIQFWSVGQNGSATLRAQTGASQKSFRLGQTLLGRAAGNLDPVIRLKQASLISDTIHERSELSVPIIWDLEVIGILSIERDRPQAISEDDVILFEMVAAHVAVAIANRTLYNHIKDESSRLKREADSRVFELKRIQERLLEQQASVQMEFKTTRSLAEPEAKSHEMIGQSSAILSLVAMVDKIAPAMAAVLIQGESGTGKELVARQLHYKSNRAEKTYVTVNCGALQESLLESELFGHEKGSFTGAFNQKIGLAETADGGTLFLDEIGEMAPGIQAKLLRFLQEGEFYRIGGKRPIQVSVRVVSATNRDLEQEVKAGRFREDLYYRLNTITLRVPPLRKRPEDIPALVEYFLKNKRYSGGGVIRRIDPRVILAFQGYPWPGNIRELQNSLERLKILAENNEIRLDDLPYSIRMPSGSKPEPAESSVELPLEAIEKVHILRTLAYHRGNKTKAAQSLGITIKTLYNKLSRYGNAAEPVNNFPQEGAHT